LHTTTHTQNYTLSLHDALPIYETAASFRDKEKKLKDKYVKEEMEWRDKLGATVPEVDEEHIAEIVSSWTGVPVSRLVEEESARLDRKSTRLNSSHVAISYAVFC